jgi:hypothetical protein
VIVATKLQIKPGQSVAVRRRPPEVDLEVDENVLADDAASADAVLVFVHSRADLDSADVAAAVEAARRDALAWVAYPKGGQLGTDLNRDSLASLLEQRDVRPVRQVSIDATWSALRFRPSR